MLPIGKYRPVQKWKLMIVRRRVKLDLSAYIPLSRFSVCSNVPGFTEPYHVVKSVNKKRLVVDMIEYMMKIQQSVCLILVRECKNLFEKLNLYLRLLIDKVKTTTQENTTHVWKDDRLREVEMYLQNFNPTSRFYVYTYS